MATHYHVIRVRSPEIRKHLNLVVAFPQAHPTEEQLEAAMRTVYTHPDARIWQHREIGAVEILANLETFGDVVDPDGKIHDVPGDDRFPVCASYLFEFGVRFLEGARGADGMGPIVGIPVEAKDENVAWNIIHRLGLVGIEHVELVRFSPVEATTDIDTTFHARSSAHDLEYARNLFEFPLEAAGTNFRTFMAARAATMSWDTAAVAFMRMFDVRRGLRPPVDHARPGAPLTHPNDADRALRDLMPVVDALTSYGCAMHDGARESAAQSLAAAVQAFERISPRSPSLPAYINWLAQNTTAGTDQPGTSGR